MDYLSLIRKPIEGDLNRFIELFNQNLVHDYGLLSDVLAHIRQQAGKRLRPILMLLMAKNYGEISDATQYSAVGLELIHTASLIHDDVVDESKERRGQASVNSIFNNKVAVLVGDYIVSTGLLNVSFTNNQRIIKYIAELGRTLAAGEILQLSNINNQEIREDVYFDVIKQKTAALFEACVAIGAASANASNEEIEEVKKFGQNLGIMFQIRDDIFDYFTSKEIGKPTGNDMAEGKLTLPVIYALNNTDFDSMNTLAQKVKAGTINQDEIAVLVEFTKQSGGIEYAEKKMAEYHQLCLDFIEEKVKDKAVKEALTAYVDYVIQRNY
jgi:octaprenyl-diphosphate synthase